MTKSIHFFNRCQQAIQKFRSTKKNDNDSFKKKEFITYTTVLLCLSLLVMITLPSMVTFSILAMSLLFIPKTISFAREIISKDSPQAPSVDINDVKDLQELNGYLKTSLLLSRQNSVPTTARIACASIYLDLIESLSLSRFSEHASSYQLTHHTQLKTQKELKERLDVLTHDLEQTTSHVNSKKSGLIKSITSKLTSNPSSFFPDSSPSYGSVKLSDLLSNKNKFDRLLRSGLSITDMKDCNQVISVICPSLPLDLLVIGQLSPESVLMLAKSGFEFELNQKNVDSLSECIKGSHLSNDQLKSLSLVSSSFSSLLKTTHHHLGSQVSKESVAPPPTQASAKEEQHDSSIPSPTQSLYNKAQAIKQMCEALTQMGEMMSVEDLLFVKTTLSKDLPLLVQKVNHLKALNAASQTYDNLNLLMNEYEEHLQEIRNSLVPQLDKSIEINRRYLKSKK